MAIDITYTNKSAVNIQQDVRKISAAVFCGYRMSDVLVATPHFDDVSVTEVLGLNILENFHIGLNFEKEELYAQIRTDFVSQKPKYQCGNVRLAQEKNT